MGAGFLLIFRLEDGPYPFGKGFLAYGMPLAIAFVPRVVHANDVGSFSVHDGSPAGSPVRPAGMFQCAKLAGVRSVLDSTVPVDLAHVGGERDITVSPGPPTML